MSRDVPVTIKKGGERLDKFKKRMLDLPTIGCALLTYIILRLAETAFRRRWNEPKSILYVRRLSDKSTVPSKGSCGAAGYDLYSPVDTVIPAKGKTTVFLDISIELPKGCYGRIAPRSGLAVKHFIDVGAGVVDRDFRGNVGVVMFNFSDAEYRIRTGDRIAQLICERIDDSTRIVETPNLVTKTERGVGGMGSTGY